MHRVSPQFLPEQLILCLGPKNLLLHLFRGYSPKIAMGPAVVSHFKQGIGHELQGPLRMGPHPFAAGKESGFDTVQAQVIDNISVIPGDLAGTFAEVERQCDDFSAV